VLKVGITGGIGSGKSVVSRLFALLGIPVYHADDAAKRLMEEDTSLRNKISHAFGEQAYQQGKLNRTYISTLAFSDKQVLERLNGMVHPAVIADAEQWMARQSAPYTIKEAALFFESGSAVGMDFIIGVYAPAELRIQRAMRRDGLGAQQIRERMGRQIDDEIKMRLCDHVVVNDDKHMVIPQVIALHNMLLRRC
jgi:dephospho-CoA kinase